MCMHKCTYWYSHLLRMTFRTSFGLLCSIVVTVIQDEAIDQLANFIGVGEEIGKCTQRAMNGLLTFREALTQRLGIMRPTFDQLETFAMTHPTLLTPGIRELVAELRRRQIDVYLVSAMKCSVSLLLIFIKVSLLWYSVIKFHQHDFEHPPSRCALIRGWKIHRMKHSISVGCTTVHHGNWLFTVHETNLVDRGENIISVFNEVVSWLHILMHFQWSKSYFCWCDVLLSYLVKIAWLIQKVLIVFFALLEEVFLAGSGNIYICNQKPLSAYLEDKENGEFELLTFIKAYTWAICRFLEDSDD